MAHTPRIQVLSGKKSALHIEAPHAAQASDKDFFGMVKHALVEDEAVQRGIVYMNHKGFGLIWQNDAEEIELGGLRFVREEGDVILRAHPEDVPELAEVLIPFFKQTYDFGTEELADALYERLHFPTLIDEQHRYVGGDLNRSPGTPNLYGPGTNAAKWKAWQEAENSFLEEGRAGTHVAVCLHSMDKRPHRRFMNEDGEYEYDREIIIGTRFGRSVDPTILAPFFVAFEEALEAEFDKVPRVKLDLEFIGDKVLRERRDAHVEAGRDVHYIQIEFMKYLLKGEAFEKIVKVLEAACKALDTALLNDNLALPMAREEVYQELDDWLSRMGARAWEYDVEVISGEAHEVRLSAQQREYLRVDVGDVIFDEGGEAWIVTQQEVSKARPYTEMDKVTVVGAEVLSIKLVRR